MKGTPIIKYEGSVSFFWTHATSRSIKGRVRSEFLCLIIEYSEILDSIYEIVERRQTGERSFFFFLILKIKYPFVIISVLKEAESDTEK